MVDDGKFLEIDSIEPNFPCLLTKLSRDVQKFGQMALLHHDKQLWIQKKLRKIIADSEETFCSLIIQAFMNQQSGSHFLTDLLLKYSSVNKSRSYSHNYSPVTLRTVSRRHILSAPKYTKFYVFIYSFFMFSFLGMLLFLNQQ